MKNVRREAVIWINLATIVITWVILIFLSTGELKISWEAVRGMARIRAKIYHKPIESLHRPIEAVTVEAKAHWRNA